MKLSELGEGLAKPTYRDRDAEKVVTLLVNAMVKDLKSEQKRQGPHFIQEIAQANSWHEELGYIWDNFSEKYADEIIERVKEHFKYV